MRRVLTVVAAAAVGLAAWVTLGVIGLTGAVPIAGTNVTDAVAPVRLGLLPSPLWAIVVAAAAALCFLRRPAATATVPLLALVLLPWLPIALPAAALMWTGPLTWVVWTAWSAATVMEGVRGSLPAWLHDPRRAVRIAFVAAALAYGVGLWLAAPTVPAGDEPHYLIIARSLAADGDLRIENNHIQRDYLPFFEGELKPDYLRRGVDGQIYSIHAPGLPALIAPVLALFGHRGAALFLALVSAWGTTLAWRLAHEVSGDPGAAWFGWAAVGLTAPFFLHAFTIYPDACASVLVVTGLLAFVRAEAPALSPARALCHGAALAYLPWLHTRYAILAAVLGASVVLRLVTAGRVRHAATFLIVPIVSACAWFAFFQAIYGTPSPSAPYGGYTQTAFAHIGTGLAGLLFDEQFGLLTTAPILLCALVGLGAMMGPWRRASEGGYEPGRFAVVLLLAIVPYAMAAAAYRMWWGGFSAPARFLVPIVLPLAVPLAVVWTRARSAATRALALWMLLWSVGFVWWLVGVDGGAMAYTTRTPLAEWARRLSPVVDLARGLPSVHRGPLPVALAQAAAWLCTLLLAWIALRGVERSRRTSALDVMRVWAPPVLALAVSVGITLAWTIEGVVALRPVASELALVNRAASMSARVGLAFDSGAWPWLIWRRQPVAGTLSSVRLRPEPGEADGLRRGEAALILPALPAGHYRLSVVPSGALPGRIFVGVGRTPTPVLSFDTALSPPTDVRGTRVFDVDLPVRVAGLTVRADTSGLAAAEVTLQPLIVVRGQGSPDGEAQSAVAYGDSAVYFASEGAFPEPTGFWIRPGREVTVAIVRPDATAPLTVRLRNTPVANHVTIRAGSVEEAWEMLADAERVVTISASASRVVVLRIRAEQGVRPADRDPASGDLRRLGLWVEIVRT